MKTFSRICGAVAALAGMLVLLGWAADVQALKRISPGWVAMNPVTALAFVLSGISLSLLARNQAAAEVVTGPGVARVFAAVAALIGLLKLGGYLLGREMPVDQFLFAARLAGDPAALPNRMAPNTALNFLLCGSALLLLDVKVVKRLAPAPLLSLASASLALLAVAGYTLGTNSFYHVGTYIPMALHTALAFLVLSVGVLAARPGLDPARLLGSANMGGATMRRLLPAAVLVPFGLGFLWQSGARHGYFDPQLGVPLMVVSSIACFTTIVLFNALSLEKNDMEREQAERALRKSAAQIHDLYNKAPCGYHSVDAAGVFIAINDTELEWLGYTRAELIGKVNIAHLMTPASRVEFQKTFALLKQHGQVRDIEYDFVRKNGSIMPVLLNATGLEDDDDHHFFTRASVFDITARKRAEEDRKQLNEELRQRTAQLETLNHELEAFSYSVSHDLRAPIRHISGFVDLLARQDVGSDPKTRRYLGFIADSARQMGRLVDDLLSFSRMARSEMHVASVDLNHLVAEIRAQLADSCLNRSITWRVGQLPELRADAAMLRLVLVNLLSNAIKYTGRCPQAEIEVAWQPGAEEETICIRDNGVGFDMKYAGKLFGVFQRLHHRDEFEGTGIGLANVRRIIHRHGGRVWAEGVVGQGATFYFTFPKKPNSTAPAVS